MSIGLAILGLTYFFILVMAYVFVIYCNEKEENRSLIINKAYQYAYSILFFSIFIVLTLVFLPHITLDNQTASYLILASKFFSVVTLAVSIYFFSKKQIEN